MGLSDLRTYRGRLVLETTDDYRRIDIRSWQREGLLAPPKAFRWQWTMAGSVKASVDVRTTPGGVVLDYRHRVGGQGWQDTNCRIQLAWTDCHLGGQRPWFLCPAPGCARRVAILYVGEAVACRSCLRLAYASQREVEYDRKARRANRVRDVLGWQPGIFTAAGGKPKGMHWKTFQRRLVEHYGFVDKSVTGMAASLGWLEELQAGRARPPA